MMNVSPASEQRRALPTIPVIIGAHPRHDPWSRKTDTTTDAQIRQQVRLFSFPIRLNLAPDSVRINSQKITRHPHLRKSIAHPCAIPVPPNVVAERLDCVHHPGEFILELSTTTSTWYRLTIYLSLPYDTDIE